MPDYELCVKIGHKTLQCFPGLRKFSSRAYTVFLFESCLNYELNCFTYSGSVGVSLYALNGEGKNWASWACRLKSALVSVTMTIRANCQFGTLSQSWQASHKVQTKTKHFSWIRGDRKIEMNTVNNTHGNMGHRYENRRRVVSTLWCMPTVRMAIRSEMAPRIDTRRHPEESNISSSSRMETCRVGARLCPQIRSDTLITAGFSSNSTAWDLESTAYTLILQSGCQRMPCSYDKGYYPNNCIHETRSYLWNPPLESLRSQPSSVLMSPTFPFSISKSGRRGTGLCFAFTRSYFVCMQIGGSRLKERGTGRPKCRGGQADIMNFDEDKQKKGLNSKLDSSTFCFLALFFNA